MSDPGDRVEALRLEIDALDEAIARAVLARRGVVAEMREEKARRGVAFLDPAREAAVEARYRGLLAGVPEAQVHALVRAVLEGSR